MTPQGPWEVCVNLRCGETGSPALSSGEAACPTAVGFLHVGVRVPATVPAGGSALRVCFPVRPGECRNHPEQTVCLGWRAFRQFLGAGGRAGAQPVAGQGALPAAAQGSRAR